MFKNSTDVVLYRIDPSQNMQRFYTISVSSNLFGGRSLIKSWGRIGTRGQSKVEFFDDECLAHSELIRFAISKRKRGYVYGKQAEVQTKTFC
jgi:predicted DNA-binding WGR domain protein